MVTSGNTFTRQMEHVGSVHFRFEEDTWGLRADVSQGSGYLGQGDMRALMAITGLQWADMNDRMNDGGAYSGLSFTTGIRVGW